MIDVSTYAGNWPFRPLPGSTPEDLLALLNSEGIEQALVSPIEGILYDDPQLANEKLFEVLQDIPDLIPVAVLNPKLSNWRKNLDICCEKYNARAVKLYPNYHRYDLDSDDAGALLKAAGEKSIPVIVQLRVQDMRTQHPLAVASDLNPAIVINAARTYPDTKFVIGGIKQGEVRRPAVAEELTDLSNLWIDISNVEYNDGLRLLIDMFGIKKLLFGSHSPFFITRCAILKLREARLSEEELETFTRGNAIALFGIQDA